MYLKTLLRVSVRSMVVLMTTRAMVMIAAGGICTCESAVLLLMAMVVVE